MGTFPKEFLAFPLDLILAALWLIAVFALWRNGRKSLLVRFMLSSAATVSSIVLFLALCLVIGLTDNRELAGSWISVFVLLYIQTVLLFVILRGWRRKTATGARVGAIRWRFLIIHAGLLLALGSAFWGAPDTTSVRMQVEKGIPENVAYDFDGRQVWLDYEIELKDFRVETYSDGTPSMYEAMLSVDGKDVQIKVNHPYSKGFGEDIYLCGYDAESGSETASCILEVVYEPWKYGAVAGIILLLLGALLLFLGGPDRRSVINDD